MVMLLAHDDTHGARLRMGLMGLPTLQAKYRPILFGMKNITQSLRTIKRASTKMSSCDQVLLHLFVISLMLRFSSSNDLLPA